MKKLYTKIGVVAALLIGASCSDTFMDTKPTSSYDETFVFSTLDNCEAALNGMHKAMEAQYDSRQSSSGYTTFMIFMDALGEDLVFPTTGNGWYRNQWQWKTHRNVNSIDLDFSYRFWYLLISNANMILDNIDNLSGDEAKVKELKGQALTYRAMANFWLVQLFAERYDKNGTNEGMGIVLRTTSGVAPQARESVKASYKQITDDLDAAIPLLEAGAEAIPASKSNFRAYTAKGIRARVALTMQDWENASKYAGEAISEFKNDGGKLMDDEQYNEGFNSVDCPECMWGFYMIPDQTLYFFGFMAYMSYNFNSTNIRKCPKCINSDLYDQISDSDVRKGLWDPTGKAWKLPTSSFAKEKYMNRKFKVVDYSSPVADVIFMRLSEMYLIEAEAKARLGASDAADVLYTVAHQRDPEYAKSAKTGNDLVEEVLLQRRMELWGEGFRFLDLKRMNLPLHRGANHDSSVSVQMDVPAGDIKWQFLIPQDEIDSNDGLVIQNPLK